MRPLPLSYLSDLPPEWPQVLLPVIAGANARSNRRIVVLDDDPTGTQTVHGIPVLTTWEPSDLATVFAGAHPAVYLLTNSRSLTGAGTRALHAEIGRALRIAARNAGVDLELISRSDSTLRGHFPLEIDVLQETLGWTNRPCIIAPFFLEGGRYTIDDVHYVAEGDQLIPAGQTAYADDDAFGYRESNLRRWVEEKTNRRVGHADVASISLDDLRIGGPARVTECLTGLSDGSYCIVNAVSYRDMEVFVAGLVDAQSRGRDFLFRSAASLVRVRGAIAPRALLTPDELITPTDCGGLFVVGSYVPKTSGQLAALCRSDVVAVELAVPRLLKKNEAPEEVARAAMLVNRHLREGDDVVLHTSRAYVGGGGATESLSIGQRVSDALIEVVQRLTHQPRYLVAKGGITSSDVATRGLQVRRADVLGQVLPGVPAWRLGAESRYPGMAYIVFPGNVGDEGALAHIRKQLRSRVGS